jgi:Putative zinc-finger
MTHPGAEQWADFVRRLPMPTEQAALREHLDSCPECRSVVEGLETLVKVAALDAEIVIPPSVTARAYALFQVQTPSRDWLQALRKLAAELVFDDRLDPLPAGLRSGTMALTAFVRQLTYRAGDYDVDLRLEPVAAGGSEIAGQIANRHDHKEPLEGSIVQVIAGGKTVGETETNRFGEFLLEQPVRPNGTLRIALRPGGFRIDLPLRAGKRR